MTPWAVASGTEHADRSPFDVKKTLVSGYSISSACEKIREDRVDKLEKAGKSKWPLITNIRVSPARVDLVVRDSDGERQVVSYDPGLDTAYVTGANEPLLAPGESVLVFILSTIPAGAGDAQRGRVDLVAVAATGSGAPGTAFAGLGQGGGDAVVGATGADAEDDGWYRISAAAVALVKSATVADPFGGTASVPGAIITYRLVATVSGSGGLANLRIADAIPAGSTYRPGTLTLEGGPLSDAADADAGEFSGTGIAVRLGNVAGGAARIVTFQVAID